MIDARRVAWTVVVLAIFLNLALLLSGKRLLVHERVVPQGEHYVVGQWGDLAKNEAPSIVCTYWTGRSVKRIVWWFGNGFASRDECPFLHSSE